MERPRYSTIGWGLAIGGIAAIDYFAPPHEQLSERADEWLEHPIKRRAVQLGMWAVAMHVCNQVPDKIDPIHHLAMLRRRVESHEN